MASHDPSSGPAVEMMVKAIDLAISFLANIPDKGPNQGKLLGEAINTLRLAEGNLQQYVNSRASGIS